MSITQHSFFYVIGSIHHHCRPFLKRLSLKTITLITFYCGLFLYGGSAFAQQHYHVKHAEPVFLSSSATLKSDNKTRFTFSAFNKLFDIELTPNLKLTDNKLFAGVELLQGTLLGIDNSWVRISYVDGKVSGAIYDGAELFLIDDSSLIQSAMTENTLAATGSETAIFKASDIVGSGQCALHPEDEAVFSLEDLTAELEQSASIAFAAGATRQLNIAIVADSQYIASSNDNTSGQVLSQMNIVDGIFSGQIGVQLKVTELRELQNNGPLTSFDPSTLLDQFRSYVNSSMRNPGLAHLFSGKDLSGNVIGIAYLNAICGTSGVGLTEAGGRGTYGALTAAHEFGHNFGAPHDNQGGSACLSTPGTFLMNPSINGSDQFSACSRNQIANVLSRVSCLVNVGDPDPQPDPVAATIQSPSPNSTLTGNAVDFSWNRPAGSTNFDLLVGTQGPGSNNIRSSSPFNATSLRVNNLPVDGSRVYVRLWTFNSGAWQFNDYTYTATTLVTEPKAVLQSPVPGSTLTATSQTFSWNRPQGATAFDLIIGTGGPGSGNIRSTNVINATSLTVSGLPSDGSKVYVRLWTFNNSWAFTDYTYTATRIEVEPKAVLQSPVPGSTLTATSQTFSWNRPQGATAFDVIIGTSGPGSGNIRSSNVINATSLSVSGLPDNGSTVYVRLWTFNTGWAFTDYTYKAFTKSTTPAPLKASLTSPAVGSRLATSATFTWTKLDNAIGYGLSVGTSGVGSNDVLNNLTLNGTTTALTVNNIPKTGGIIYVRLWTQFDTFWRITDYQFTAPSP